MAGRTGSEARTARAASRPPEPSVDAAGSVGVVALLALSSGSGVLVEVPGVVLVSDELELELETRKKIRFNVCLRQIIQKDFFHLTA